MRLTDIDLKTNQSYDTPYGKIMLVGLLENGPTGQPFSLNPNKDIIDSLGNNPMTQTAIQLNDSGIDINDIIFYRINGTNAKYEYIINNKKVFDFVGIEASNKQNNVQITFSQNGLMIRSNYNSDILEYAESNYLRTYLYKDYPHTSQLANAINSDAVLGLIDIIAREYDNMPTFGLFQEGIVNLDGGNNETYYINQDLNDEINRHDYYRLFSYHLLGEGYEDFTISNSMSVNNEVMLFPDIEIDKFPEMGELASYIAEQKSEQQNANCYAIFKTSPVPPNDINLDDLYINGTEFLIRNPDLLEQGLPEESDNINASDIYQPYERQEVYTQKLLSLYTENNQTYSNYQYLMIVVGNNRQEDSPGGDIPLAVAIATTEPSIGLSNKEISNFNLDNVLTPDMLARLTKKGYICIVPSARKNQVFQLVQSMDLYTEGSILKNWSNRRTFSEFVFRLEEIFNQYVGRPISYLSPNLLRKELEAYIQEYVSKGRIQIGHIEYIEFSPLSLSVQLKIKLTFYQEVEKIEGSIEITKDRWDIDIWNLVA